MSLFKFWRIGAFVAGGALLVSGCGGGGGATVPTPTPSGTPIATSISPGCTAETFRPNYYGLRDPSDSDSSGNIYNRWRQFAIRVYIPPSTSAAFRNATLAGFDQWVSATDGRASYQLVGSASEADMVISYAPQNPSSDTLGLTRVTYNPNTNTIISVRMDLFFYPSDSASNQSIAAHEYGHALGISPHSPFDEDLMFPTLERARAEVTTRDENTLKTVYCNNFPTRSTAAVKDDGARKTIVIRN